MADPMRIRANEAGGVTTVRVLMSHPMEPGTRRDRSPAAIARAVWDAGRRRCSSARRSTAAPNSAMIAAAAADQARPSASMSRRRCFSSTSRPISTR